MFKTEKKYFLIALFVILLPVIGRLAFNNFDTSVFIVAGRNFVDESKLPDNIQIFGNRGYDGQLYYKIALDLFSETYREERPDKISPYRKQRILYPLLAGIISFSKPEMLSIVMIVINCLFLLGVWFIFFSYCKRNEINLLYSILPLLYSGFHMSIGRDLAEPGEAFFILGMLYFITHKKTILFCIFSTLAFFTKETTLIFVLPLTFLLILNKYRREALKLKNIALLISPYIIFSVWKLHLFCQFGKKAILPGTSNLGPPFLGFFKGISRYFNDISVENSLVFLIAFLHLAWLIWLILLVFSSLRRSLRFSSRSKSGHNVNSVEDQYYPMIAWASWLFFSLFLSEKIYEDIWSYVRIFTSFVTISFFILISNRHKFKRYFCIFTVFLFLLTTFQLWFLP